MAVKRAKLQSFFTSFFKSQLLSTPVQTLYSCYPQGHDHAQNAFYYLPSCFVMLYDFLLCRCSHECNALSSISIQSRQIMWCISCLCKNCLWPFLMDVFKHDLWYSAWWADNFCLALCSHTRFNDPDPFSRSQESLDEIRLHFFHFEYELPAPCLLLLGNFQRCATWAKRQVITLSVIDVRQSVWKVWLG